MTQDDPRNDRLDQVIEGLHKNNLGQTELLGEIKLMKQRLESLENMNALKAQVQDVQNKRMEESIKTLELGQDVMKIQIVKAQGMFAVIAVVITFLMSFVQSWINGLIGK